jgi:predicted PurR-regulated permease PerM
MDEFTREGTLADGDGEASRRRGKKAQAEVSKSNARIISIGVLLLMLVTVWYMLDLALLTFVIGFIFNSLLLNLRKITDGTWIRKIPDGILLLLMYLLLMFILVFGGAYFAPRLMTQFTAIAELLQKFSFDAFRASLDPALADALANFDLTPYVAEAAKALMDGVRNFGVFGVNLLLALVLSLFLLVEKNKLKRFGEVFAVSRISFLYEYFMNFSRNFTRSFGNVMKVQVLIAFINCVLSMLMLAILGFPQILGLGIMIFFLGLIPVAGVLVSLVPLSVVAFSIGGMPKVLAVVVMVAVIHALEAYVLNPKLMSDKTSLPVSFVFIILVVAEHYLKVWGLLIGVPLFVFLLDMFEVDYRRAFKPEKGVLSMIGANMRRGGATEAKHAKRRGKN